MYQPILTLLVALTILQKLLKTPNSSNWKEFLAEYSKVIFYPIRQFTDDEDEQMDLYVFACESLVKNNFAKLRKFRILADGRKAKFTTWLVLVVKNLCIDWYRSKKGRFRLFKAVQNLGSLEKKIFELLYLRGFTIQETFEIINQDEQNQIDIAKFYESLRRLQDTLTRQNRNNLAYFLLKHDDRKMIKRISEISSIPETLQDDAYSQPDLQLNQKATMQILKELLSELSSEDRFLLKLWFDSNLPAKRIADLLGYKESTQVYSRIYRITNLLRARFKAKNISKDDLEILLKLNSLF